MPLYENLTSIDSRKFRLVTESVLGQGPEAGDEQAGPELDQRYPALTGLLIDLEGYLETNITFTAEQREIFIGGATFVLLSLIQYAEAERTAAQLPSLNED